MKSAQEQLTVQRRIDIKLDKITRMLNALLKKMDQMEPELDKSLAKKIAKEWKGIENGKVKIYHYNNLKEFEKAIS